MTRTMTALFGIIVAGALAVAWGASPLSAQGATCRQACLLYRSCVVEHGKKQNPPRTATKQEFEKLYAGCMKTCGQHKAKVLACYKESKNACTAYYACIQRNYKK